MDEITKMEKDNLLKTLLPVLTEFVNTLLLDLIATPGISQLGLKIKLEAWINDNGIGLGALSFFSKPIDAAVDLTIDLKQAEASVFVDIGIYWSDGSVIQEISRVELHGKDMNGKFLAFLQENHEKTVNALSEFLLGND